MITLLVLANLAPLEQGFKLEQLNFKVRTRWTEAHSRYMWCIRRNKKKRMNSATEPVHRDSESCALGEGRLSDRRDVVVFSQLCILRLK